MFVTFELLNSERMRRSNEFIWWYGQVYLYTCISFFTYVVLNLFIGVILDAYYAIKVRILLIVQLKMLVWQRART